MISFYKTRVTIYIIYRGKCSFDQAGVGAEMPAEVNKEDNTFETYRKRMMLAYRFRPNPLVQTVVCMWYSIRAKTFDS